MSHVTKRIVQQRLDELRLLTRARVTYSLIYPTRSCGRWPTTWKRMA